MLHDLFPTTDLWLYRERFKSKNPYDLCSSLVFILRRVKKIHCPMKFKVVSYGNTATKFMFMHNQVAESAGYK